MVVHVQTRGHVTHFEVISMKFLLCWGGEEKRLWSQIGTRRLLQCFADLPNWEQTPGNDGLTVLTYLVFWPVFGSLLVESLNYAFEYGELSNSQKQAVITLVEKKGKDKRQIKNWRPISWPSGWKIIHFRNNSFWSERLCQGDNYFWCHQNNGRCDWAYDEQGYIGDLSGNRFWESFRCLWEGHLASISAVSRVWSLILPEERLKPTKEIARV